MVPIAVGGVAYAVAIAVAHSSEAVWCVCEYDDVRCMPQCLERLAIACPSQSLLYESCALVEGAAQPLRVLCLLGPATRYINIAAPLVPVASGSATERRSSLLSTRLRCGLSLCADGRVGLQQSETAPSHSHATACLCQCQRRG